MCGRNLELEVFPLTSLNLRGKMVHWFEMKESCQLLEWRDWDLCYTISLLTCKIQRNVRKNETKYSSVAKSKRRLVGQNMGYCLNSSTLQYGLQWQAVEYLEYQEVIDRVPEQIKLFLMFHTSTSPSEGFSLRWVEFRVNWLFHDLTFSQANNKEVGHDIFSTLWMKGQVLHCEQAHLKVPVGLLVWNELPIKNCQCFCHVWIKLVKVVKR